MDHFSQNSHHHHHHHTSTNDSTNTSTTAAATTAIHHPRSLTQVKARGASPMITELTLTLTLTLTQVKARGASPMITELTNDGHRKADSHELKVSEHQPFTQGFT